MTTTEIAAGVSFGIAVLSFILGQFKSKISSELEGRIIKLETKWELYSRYIEGEIGKMLHSPHRAELDSFIEKNASSEGLTHAEAEQFISLLEELLAGDELKSGEIVGATLLKASVAARCGIDLENK